MSNTASNITIDNWHYLPYQIALSLGESIISVSPRAQMYTPPAPLVVWPIPIVKHRVARQPINDQVDWRKSGF